MTPEERAILKERQCCMKLACNIASTEIRTVLNEINKDSIYIHIPEKKKKEFSDILVNSIAQAIRARGQK